MYPAAFAGKPSCWRARSEPGHLSEATGSWGPMGWWARHGEAELKPLGGRRTGQERPMGVEAQRGPLAGRKSERPRFGPAFFKRPFSHALL